MTGSDNLVDGVSKFMTSGLAFRGQAGCDSGIFEIGLLFLHNAIYGSI